MGPVTLPALSSCASEADLFFEELSGDSFWPDPDEAACASSPHDAFSLEALWDQTELDAEPDAESVPAPVTPAVSVFQDGLDLGRLWTDLEEQPEHDAKHRVGGRDSLDVFRAEDISRWSFDKIFLATRDIMLQRLPAFFFRPRRLNLKGPDAARLLREATKIPFLEDSLVVIDRDMTFFYSPIVNLDESVKQIFR